MTAEDTLRRLAMARGWTLYIMLHLACEYIDNQQQEDVFEDFLVQQAKTIYPVLLQPRSVMNKATYVK